MLESEKIRERIFLQINRNFVGQLVSDFNKFTTLWDFKWIKQFFCVMDNELGD